MQLNETPIIIHLGLLQNQLIYFVWLAIEFQSLIVYIRRIAFLLCKYKSPFEITHLKTTIKYIFLLYLY